MLYLNVVSIALILAGSAVLWQQTSQIAESARVYPQLLIALVAIFGIVTIVQTFLTRKTLAPLSGDLQALLQSTPHVRLRTLGFAIVWLVYPLAMTSFGFILATIVALSVSLWLLRSQKLLIGILSAVVFAFALSVLFETVLYIPVPAGVLDDAVANMIYSM